MTYTSHRKFYVKIAVLKLATYHAILLEFTLAKDGNSRKPE